MSCLFYVEDKWPEMFSALQHELSSTGEPIAALLRRALAQYGIPMVPTIGTARTRLNSDPLVIPIVLDRKNTATLAKYAADMDISVADVARGALCRLLGVNPATTNTNKRSRPSQVRAKKDAAAKNVDKRPPKLKAAVPPPKPARCVPLPAGNSRWPGGVVK